MKYIWNGSSEIQSKNEDQEEITNMCFMAIDDERRSLELNDESNDDAFDNEFDDLSYEKLLYDFNGFYKNYE